MSLKDDMKKVIGNIWYLRDHFGVISKHKGLVGRARSVEEILVVMAKYEPKEKTFSEQLVLDNYLGSLQHFLTGYDTSSIHLSSMSMEVALVFGICEPTNEERRKGRHKTFSGLRRIAIQRNLVKSQKSIKASQRVIDRRNMFVHDAILKQAIEIEQEKWLNDSLDRLPKRLRESFETVLLLPAKGRFEKWKSLPDLSWYLRSRSYNATRRMIREFFEILNIKIEEDLSPLRARIGDRSYAMKVWKLPQVIKNIKTSLYSGETDFIKHCAKMNLEDVKIVLDDIYEGKLFK